MSSAAALIFSTNTTVHRNPLKTLSVVILKSEGDPYMETRCRDICSSRYLERLPDIASYQVDGVESPKMACGRNWTDVKSWAIRQRGIEGVFRS